MPIVHDRLSSLALVGTGELHNLQSPLSFVVQIENWKMIPPCFCLPAEAWGPYWGYPKKNETAAYVRRRKLEQEMQSLSFTYYPQQSHVIATANEIVDRFRQLESEHLLKRPDSSPPLFANPKPIFWTTLHSMINHRKFTCQSCQQSDNPLLSAS